MSKRARRARISLAFALLALASASIIAAGQADPSGSGIARPETRTAAQREPSAQTLRQEGLAVALAIQPVSPNEHHAGELLQGQDVEVRLTIRDQTTGTPVPALRPAAWMDLRRSAQPIDAGECRAKVQAFVNASLSARPTVDLNVYYVLAMNDDASISVVDPLFGYGGSKLLTTVRLPGPGTDWVLSRDGKTLYVSVPLVNQVAIVDTATWKTVKNIDVGPRPARVALQPDENYLWVGSDADRGGTGNAVTIIDTAQRKVVSRIIVGPGPHELAFTPDDRYAFVTNQTGNGTVTVVDIRALEKVADIEVGPSPSAAAFSEHSQAVYVASEGNGVITVIDGASHTVRQRIQAAPGLRALRFAPGGRWGLVVNEKQSVVHVFDTASNRIVQTAPVGKAPDQIAFSANSAFVRSTGSVEVSMIALNSLGQRENLPVLEFPGGLALPEGTANPAAAPSIVGAPEGNAVLVANASDKTIYYYAEGMAAPMGSFKNYGRHPRAVLVVDRSLRETAPGVYSTTVKLPASGTYDVAFLLDSPRITHCFEAFVKPDPAAVTDRAPLKIEPLLKDRRIPVGEPFRLPFRATDPTTNAPLSGLKDIRVLIFQAGGNWNQREWAQPDEEGGYHVMFTVPQPGAYFVSFESALPGARLHKLEQIVLHAGTPGAAFQPKQPNR